MDLETLSGRYFIVCRSRGDCIIDTFGRDDFRRRNIQNDQSGDSNSSTLVPVVFPLIAGPASFTTLLSMRAEYQTINIIVAILLNLAIVYLVLRFLDPVKRILGVSGAYILRKFFGVILMAISIRLLTSNMSTLIASFQ